jgi:hypothetical protein
MQIIAEFIVTEINPIFRAIFGPETVGGQSKACPSDRYSGYRSSEVQSIVGAQSIAPSTRTASE